MIKEALERAVDDMIRHLGQEVTFEPRSGESCKILAVIKTPDNPYELGDVRVIDQVADVTVKSSDITPKIGDYIRTDSQKYKIYSDPLLDASALLWRFNAVSVGE